jgi:hypothetical protein
MYVLAACAVRMHAISPTVVDDLYVSLFPPHPETVFQFMSQPKTGCLKLEPGSAESSQLSERKRQGWNQMHEPTVFGPNSFLGFLCKSDSGKVPFRCGRSVLALEGGLHLCCRYTCIIPILRYRR